MQTKLILKHRYQNSKYNSNKWNLAIFTGKIIFKKNSLTHEYKDGSTLEHLLM